MQLRFKLSDCILLPEYICDVVLHPLNQLGLKYRYYSVNDRLEPRWDELPDLVNEQTRAFMMVHYFGQPQDISAFQSFCIKHKLLLIEDNAHGHGGMLNGQLLGTYGDLGISSPRKIINTFSGGTLWLKDLESNHKQDLLSYPVPFIKRYKNSLLNSYPNLKYSIRKVLKNRPQYEDSRAFREPIMQDYAIDSWSESIIEQIDWNELRKTRQAVYYNWQNFALENGLTPVYSELNPEANPWCFPAYAKNQQDAIKWFSWGWDHNKHVFSWPSLPVEILEKQGESLDRWERIICFGIG